MRVATIGFAQKSAERFFSFLSEHGVTCVVDIRLRPDGQLAGFARRNDLPFFLHALSSCEYVHMPQLAPTREILDGYRADHDWSRYVREFEGLMDERNIPGSLDRTLFETNVCCLLCSEPTPEQCHRGLIAKRLSRHWDDVVIEHL